ncbi:DUF4389 domain-containing protein [Streptomyces sp. NBC_00237]|uniref:DUF4389 domain-containing protein n=1 Tax=Streptomyces sp. NBC_00237 TaxID=2975687 RepID=UPI0022506FE4|nr:DUF4389 domain-containing protein [Streptomyces sp. NBC_00237]MCX5205503.1 DUF4389 domain-containing protein [Streptomyces sp. NBC_00237]
MATDQNPRPASGDEGGGEWLPVLDVPAPGRQRRWTVLLRWLLLVPQFIVVGVLGVAAFFVTIVGWFAALFAGRLPDGVFRFLGSVLAYRTRVNASATLLVDRYPPFSFAATGYPVQIQVRPTPLNRAAVFFRLVLMIPAVIIGGLLQSGWAAVSWVFWLVTLVLGRLPAPLYAATAAVARYTLRLNAYVSLLTPAYPQKLFGDAPAPTKEAAASGTRPLVLDTTGRVLLVLFLLLGLAGHIVNATTDYRSDDSGSTVISTP